MTFQLADRVQETTTTTGTGSLALGGAVTNFQTFGSIMANGDTTYYALVDSTNSAWEVGVGTWNTGNSLSRTTVLASSNSGSVVSLGAGTKNVFMDFPAYAARNGPIKLSGTFTANGSLSTPVPPFPALISDISVQNSTANAVTLNIGVTATGSEIYSGAVIPGTTVPVTIAGAALLLRAWAAGQTIYVSSANWNSASVVFNLWFIQ